MLVKCFIPERYENAELFKVGVFFLNRIYGTGTKHLQTKRLQTKRLQTKRLRDKTSTGRFVPVDLLSLDVWSLYRIYPCVIRETITKI